MAKVKAPKCKNKDEFKAWIRSQGRKNVDKASIKRENKRLKKVK